MTRYGYFRVKSSGNVVKAVQVGRWVYINDNHYESSAFEWLGARRLF